MKKIVLAVLVAVAVAGCQTTPEPAPVEDKSASTAAPGSGSTSGTSTSGTNQGGVSGSATGAANPLRDPNNILSKRNVFFEYDSFTVGDQYKPIVEAHARYLNANRNARIALQGHADERGSREYNIALGQKRADAVKRMMTLLGVQDVQIETVSFGKEKPKNLGHDEQRGPRTVASTSSTPGSDMKQARLVLVALAVAASASAAHAGLFDDEEARKQIAATSARLDAVQKNLEARLADLEQQAKGRSLDLLHDLEGIKADIAKIRGQIEVLTYELTEAQKRQRDLYVDLDSRMRKIEAAGAATGASAGGAVPADAAAAGVPGSPPAQVAGTPSQPGTPATQAPAQVVPVTAAEQRAYDGALDQFKRGDYPGAISGFSGFVKTYPKSLLAPSAQYWVGNAQYARRDYRGAIAAQRQLIQVYPDSPKVPDALLNIASAQSEMGDNTSARRTLQELLEKFPQSEAAGKAKQRLGSR